MKNILLIFTLLFISCDSDDPVSPGSEETFDYTYNLEDLNPTSSYYQEYVGPASFPNQITIHYFGHFTWGTCASLYGQLNALYENLLLNNVTQIKLIGIGKESQISSIGNWTATNDAIVCADANNATWSNWGASQRDLFILDHEGNVQFNQNISSGISGLNLESLITELANLIPSN